MSRDPLRVLGVDPGETIGWALLETGKASPPRVLDVGAWSSDGFTYRRPSAGGEIVAIERAEKPHPASLVGGPGKVTGIVKGLLVAAWVGGRIAERAEAAGAIVVEVSASEARRAIGVVIGGSRKGPTCETCAGSGAGLEGVPGSTMAPEVLRDEAMEVRERAAELIRLNEAHARGKKQRIKLLKGIRLKACASYPCPSCHGSGERKPPSVDQQVAQILPGLVTGWPERSNVHERDACVAALHAIRIGGHNG